MPPPGPLQVHGDGGYRHRGRVDDVPVGWRSSRMNGVPVSASGGCAARHRSRGRPSESAGEASGSSKVWCQTVQVRLTDHLWYRTFRESLHRLSGPGAGGGRFLRRRRRGRGGNPMDSVSPEGEPCCGHKRDLDPGPTGTAAGYLAVIEDCRTFISGGVSGSVRTPAMTTPLVDAGEELRDAPAQASRRLEADLDRGRWSAAAVPTLSTGPTSRDRPRCRKCVIPRAAR
jgi:hypothetical protein